MKPPALCRGGRGGMMNIEAIQKRNERFGDVFCGGESIGDFDPLEIAMDRRDLLDYISELIEAQRWKKVAEEKPPLCKEILLKNRIGADVQTLYAEPDGRLYFLYRDIKIYPQDETTEWREIE
jgi:hypothetical protein